METTLSQHVFDRMGNKRAGFEEISLESRAVLRRLTTSALNNFTAYFDWFVVGLRESFHPVGNSAGDTVIIPVGLFYFMPEMSLKKPYGTGNRCPESPR